jgi:hypothetical protein
MYQHVVLFSFPDELSAADWDEMQSRVRSWPAKIGGMEKLRLGRPSSDSVPDGYQYLLFIEFADEDKLNHYLGHPVHKDFGQWAIVELGAKAIVFRYALDEGTVII